MQHESLTFLRPCSARACCSPFNEDPGLDISSASVYCSSSNFPSRERPSSAPSFMSSAGGLSSESKFVVRREDRSSELVQSAIGLALSSSLPFRVFPPVSIFADLPALFIWDLALELRLSLPVSPSAPSRSAQHWTSSFSRMVRMACL